jgi:hypothetical protein
MSSHLQKRERELKLEKIRGKARSTPSKPKAAGGRPLPKDATRITAKTAPVMRALVAAYPQATMFHNVTDKEAVKRWERNGWAKQITKIDGSAAIGFWAKATAAGKRALEGFDR